MDNTGKPMSIGTILVIVILAGVVVGAIFGVIRNEFGGPTWLAGALSGAIAGGVAQVLNGRRTRALDQHR